MFPAIHSCVGLQNPTEAIKTVKLHQDMHMERNHCCNMPQGTISTKSSHICYEERKHRSANLPPQPPMKRIQKEAPSPAQR